MDPEFPSPAFCTATTGLCMHVFAIASALTNHGPGPDRDWLARVKAAAQAVRGNRPDGATVTWADLRLYMVAMLRECLARLDCYEGD